jgi:hypothetical protein
MIMMMMMMTMLMMMMMTMTMMIYCTCYIVRAVSSLSRTESGRHASLRTFSPRCFRIRRSSTPPSFIPAWIRCWSRAATTASLESGACRRTNCTPWYVVLIFSSCFQFLYSVLDVAFDPARRPLVLGNATFER